MKLLHHSIDHDRSIRWIIFLLLLTCYSYFLPRWADWGQNARLDLALAMVDEQTFSIDNYYQNTGDYAYFEGHYYLDKAPGPSFLAAPVYAIIRPILKLPIVQNVMMKIGESGAFKSTLSETGTGILANKVYFMIVLYIVTFLLCSIPSAWLGVMIYDQLSMFSLSHGWRFALVAIYGLATPAFPYSGVFYSHQMCAFLLFTAFRLIHRMGQTRIQKGLVLLAGLLLGWSVISEYSTSLIAGAIFLYFISQKPFRSKVVWLIAGGLIPGLLLAGFNWSVYHTILPVGYKYSINYEALHSVGIISISTPSLNALWGITFGNYRGLFFVAPILFLGLFGYWTWWKSKQYRAIWWLSIWSVGSFFLFNGSSVMWQGGFSVGPRYLIPMLPFLMLSLSALTAHWKSQIWYRLLFFISAIWSFAVVWVETIGGQSFPDWRLNPLFTYSIPNLALGDIARNLGMAMGLQGWTSIIPLLLFVGCLFFLFLVIKRKIPIEPKQVS